MLPLWERCSSEKRDLFARENKRESLGSVAFDGESGSGEAS